MDLLLNLQALAGGVDREEGARVDVWWWTGGGGDGGVFVEAGRPGAK